jgi:hypothetical protein
MSKLGILISLLLISFCTVPPKFCSSSSSVHIIHYSSNYHHLFITICMLMRLNSASIKLQINSMKMFLYFETQLLKSLHGCLQIVLCSILHKLNSYLLACPNNFPCRSENPSLSLTHIVTFLSPVSSARNLGVPFASYLSNFFKSRLFHVRDVP